MIFQCLEVGSENGLSFEVCGRLWDLTTPRSARISAVALAFTGVPKGHIVAACNVSWSGGTACLAMASENRA